MNTHKLGRWMTLIAIYLAAALLLAAAIHDITTT